MVVPLHHTTQVILVVLGLCLFLALSLWGSQLLPRQRRGVERALLLVGLVSVLGYFRFFSFHPYGEAFGGDHVYHYPDVYHYYVGAKYFPEVGYYGLYESTFLAFDELRAEGAPAPGLANVRDLRDQDHLVPAAEIRARRQKTLANFTPKRWSEFREDLRFLLSRPMSGRAWYSILGDMGFNSPPSWNVTASPLANLIPLNATSIELVGFLDLALVLGLGSWLVLRTFGKAALGLFLVVVGNNWIASYDWTGGSFLRLAWLAFLVVAIALLERRKWFWAGVAFGLAALDRVWPVLFLGGAGLALLVAVHRRQSRWTDLGQLCLGVAAVAPVIIGLSLVLFPGHYWGDFFEKLWRHDSTYFSMHIGFQKLVVSREMLPGPPGWAGDGYVAWEDKLRAHYQEHFLLWRGVKTCAIASSVFLATRLRPTTAALVVGATLLYFTSMPANYYYGYLALFVLAFWNDVDTRGRSIRLGGLLLLLIGFLLAPLHWRSQLEHNGVLNALILGYLVLIHLSLWYERWRDERELATATTGA